MELNLLKHYQESFDNIYIHPDSLSSDVARRFTSLFPEKIKSYDEKKQQKLKPSSGIMTSEEFNQSKRNILIKPYEGNFFKQCPGNNSLSACCNYFVLNLGSQCHFNCSYCYLQTFLNTPYLIVYSNIEKALAELEDVIKKLNGKTVRVGTGEVIDSLGLDPITEYSKKIIHFLKDKEGVTLELKTKSDFINHLLSEASEKTTFSWSINPELIIKEEEHGTANLKQRLEAARKCRDAGFKIGFHIDPVIWHSDWKKSYLELIESINLNFKPSDVPYISLGALRIQPEQRHMMKERFKRDSFVNQAEMLKSSDGKLRYDASLRSEMFKFIVDGFKSKNRAWNIFLCMESPETWLSTYENYPSKVDGLKDLFTPRPSL